MKREPTLDLDGYLRHAEVHPEATWQALRWLMSAGADEFSLVLVGLEGLEAPHLRDLEQELAPHSNGLREREHLTARRPDDLIRATPVWVLTDATVEILRSVFSDGLFEYPAYQDVGGWVEEPCIYRSGDLVLSVISHEAEGMVRLSADEYHRLAREVGLTLHPDGRWI